MKIKLNIGREVELGWLDATEEFIKSATLESAWRLGVGVVSGLNVKLERRRTLSGYEFRIGDAILATPVESYMPTEYMDWRDG